MRYIFARLDEKDSLLDILIKSSKDLIHFLQKIPQDALF